MDEYIKAENMRREGETSPPEPRLPFKERAAWQFFKEQEEKRWFKFGGVVFLVSLISSVIIGVIIWDIKPIYGVIISVGILILYFVIGLLLASYRKKHKPHKSNLMNKIFRVLHKKHYYPEMLEERLMTFKYRGNTAIVLYDKESGYCLIGMEFGFENTHGLNKLQLRSIGYKLMSKIRYINIEIFKDNIKCSREFHCTSFRQFPKKDIDFYLEYILLMADGFFSEVQRLSAPKNSEVN